MARRRSSTKCGGAPSGRSAAAARRRQAALPRSRTCSTSAPSTAASGRRPTTAAPGSRSSTTSRPARSARSRSRRRIRTSSTSAAAKGLQRPDLSTGDGIYKSTDAGKTWTHLGLRDGQQIPQIIVDPQRSRTGCSSPCSAIRTDRTRSAASSARPTAAGRFRRCSTRTRTPAASTSCSIRRIRSTVYAVLWEARQGPWENGVVQRTGSGLFKSTDGGTTWKPLTNGLPTFADDGLGRIGIAVAPSDPQRLYATVEATRQRRPLPLRRRAARAGRWSNDDTRSSAERGGDFAEVKVDPKNPDVVYIGQRRDVEIDRRRQDVRAASAARRAATTTTASGSTRTTRTSSCSQPTRARSITRERRRDVELLVQPADRAVLSREHRQRVSRTACAAASRRAARRASRAAATTGRSRSASGTRWASRNTATSPPIRSIPTSSTAARSRATTAGPGEVQNVAPDAARAADYRTSARRRCCSRRSIPHMLYFASNTLWKTTNGGQSWTEISPDLTRKTWEVPANVGMYRDTPTPQA